MGKPFSLNAPVKRNVNAPAPRPNYNTAATSQKAVAEKTSLVEAAAATAQPTYDVAASTSKPAEGGEGPHRAQWTAGTPYPAADQPTADGAASKPFSLTSKK